MLCRLLVLLIDKNLCKTCFYKICFTSDTSTLPLLLTHDDTFISVDLVKVFNILTTESSEELHRMSIEAMLSFARRAKFAVTLEKMLADMELCARGGEFTRAVLTVALVVM